MRKRRRISKKKKRQVSKNDWGILMCVAIFLVFSLIKCSNISIFSQAREEFANFFQSGTAIATMAEDIGEKVKASSSRIFSEDAVKTFASKIFTEESTNQEGSSAEPEDKSSENELLSSSYTSEQGIPTDCIFQNPEDPSGISREAFDVPFSYQKPVEAVLSCGFGFRNHPIDHVQTFHTGLDLAAKESTPIFAFADGVVTECGENAVYGNYLKLKHENDFYTFYGHCNQILLRTGQTVSKGEKIAYVGNTGKSTGPHLHFEIWKGRYRLDPSYYVAYV